MCGPVFVPAHIKGYFCLLKTLEREILLLREAVGKVRGEKTEHFMNGIHKVGLISTIHPPSVDQLACAMLVFF